MSSIPSVVPIAPAEAQPVAVPCPGPRSLADLVGQATNVWLATVEAADPTAGAVQGNWTLVVLVQGILKGPLVSGRTPAVVFGDLHGSPMPLDQVDRIRSFLLRKQDLFTVQPEGTRFRQLGCGLPLPGGLASQAQQILGTPIRQAPAGKSAGGLAFTVLIGVAIVAAGVALARRWGGAAWGRPDTRRGPRRRQS